MTQCYPLSCQEALHGTWSYAICAFLSEGKIFKCALFSQTHFLCTFLHFHLNCPKRGVIYLVLMLKGGEIQTCNYLEFSCVSELNLLSV